MGAGDIRRFAVPTGAGRLVHVIARRQRRRGDPEGLALSSHLGLWIASGLRPSNDAMELLLLEKPGGSGKLCEGPTGLSLTLSSVFSGYSGFGKTPRVAISSRIAFSRMR